MKMENKKIANSLSYNLFHKYSHAVTLQIYNLVMVEV